MAREIIKLVFSRPREIRVLSQQDYLEGLQKHGNIPQIWKRFIFPYFRLSIPVGVASVQYSTVLLLVSVRLKQVCSSTWVANFTRGWTRCALGHACTYACAPNVPSAGLFFASVFVSEQWRALRKLESGLRSQARTTCPPYLRRQFQTTPGRPLTHGSPCLRRSVANETWLSIWARATPRNWIRFFCQYYPSLRTKKGEMYKKSRFRRNPQDKEGGRFGASRRL